MANRNASFGLSADIDKAIKAKYDVELEQKTLRWIQESLDEPTLFDDVKGSDAVHEKLKDGVILCRLINAVCDEEHQIRHINTKTEGFRAPFLMMDNIGKFLHQCQQLGVSNASLFQTVDLYENLNMHNVITCIVALSSRVQASRPESEASATHLGPREATKNVRQFSQEQLNQSKAVISLQMGSNKGASQAGMNFGKARSILD